MAEIYRSFRRRARKIFSHHRRQDSAGAPCAIISGDSLRFGDFEATDFSRCFILGDLIGETRDGKLFNAAIKGAPEGFKPCRVKRVRRWRLKRESKEALFEEVRILRTFDHPNIIEAYLFYRDDPKYFFLVLEHLSGPELFDYVSAKRGYSESDARREFEVLLETVEYIHGEEIVHRGITPGSIVLANPEEDTSMKLVDFSRACSVRGGLVSTTGGDPQFIAPEIITGESHGKSVDVWNLGVILYILLAAAHPFYHWDIRQMFENVRSGNVGFAERVWTYISDDAKDLIRRLLEVDPRTRLTASQALDHAWFSADGTDEPQMPPERFWLYNAKRKLRTAVFSVVAARMIWCLLSTDQFYNAYEMGPRLGKGAFGVVFRASLRVSREDQPRWCAVKRVNRVGISPKNEKSLRNEAEILRSLDHPNVVEFYDFFDSDPEYFFLVMELMEGGELYERITQKERYDEEEARNLCRILLGAVEHIHDQDVVHRDLKPQNLLLASRADHTTIRVADFGFACKLNGGHVRDLLGTPRYVAPEIINARMYGTPVDMWAIGVIIFQLISGTWPFNDSNQTRLFSIIRRGAYDIDTDPWNGVSDKAKDLIRGLLTLEPKDRLTATQALNHPWIVADGEDLASNDLSLTLDSLRLFNAKRKLRGSIHQVMVTRKIVTSGEYPLMR